MFTNIFQDLLLGFGFENDVLKDSFDFLIFHNKGEVAIHSQKVALQAEKLADKFGIDKDKAIKAGFLHDIGNIIPYDNILKVYSREPWNDKWESFEQAREYILEFINNPVFTGFLACEDSKIIGVCLGHMRSWWGGKEYYMNEFFIDNEMQGKGIGTNFLEFIKKNLVA